MIFFQLHRNIQLRMAVGFVTTLAMMTVLPFLAIYFTDKIGQTMVGVVLLAVVLSGICGGFVGGHFSDLIGRKKLMIAADAVTGLLFVCVAFVNSPWTDLPYVTCGLIVAAMFFMGVMEPVSQAMIVDVSTSENRRIIYTMNYWSINLAVAFGGILGAFLFSSHHFALFLGVAAVNFLSMIVTIVALSETHFPKPKEKHVNEGAGTIFSSYVKVLRDKLFVYYVLASLLLQGLEEQLTNYIGVRLDQHIHHQVLFSFGSFDFTINGLKMLGFLQTENTLFVVFFTGLFTIILRRFSDKRVLYLGAILFTLGYFVLGISLSPWVLFAAMVVVTTGELMYAPVLQSYLADIAPEDKRSSYMAVNGLIYYLAMMLAAVFVSLGAVVPFWVIAGLFLVMGGSSFFLSHRILPGLDERRNMQKGA